MSDSPLVSVILPTCSRADFLPRAVGSVLGQTYSHWELIIWDDGSTDNTRDVVRSFVDDRVRYFHDVNHGAAYARNRAIAFSRGKYIAFLDSDDEWLDDMLSLQTGILESNPDVDLVFGNFLNRDRSKDTEELWFVSKAHGLAGLDKQDRGKVHVVTSGMPESLLIANFLATDTIVTKRSLLETVGGFNTELRNSHDLELWWRLGLAGARFAYVDEVLLVRNWLPSSIARQSVVSCKNHIKALDCCRHEALARGRSDLIPRLDAAYRRGWRNLMRQHALQGDRRETLRAFRRSTRYGISRGTLLLLAKAMAGVKGSNNVS